MERSRQQEASPPSHHLARNLSRRRSRIWQPQRRGIRSEGSCAIPHNRTQRRPWAQNLAPADTLAPQVGPPRLATSPLNAAQSSTLAHERACLGVGWPGRYKSGEGMKVGASCRPRFATPDLHAPRCIYRGIASDPIGDASRTRAGRAKEDSPLARRPRWLRSGEPAAKSIVPGERLGYSMALDVGAFTPGLT
jgi:hypothetical protein